MSDQPETRYQVLARKYRPETFADLVGQEPRFQDFAIAQELLHLRAPTHGRLFKALMSAAVPGWRELEEQCGMPCLNCERGAS